LSLLLRLRQIKNLGETEPKEEGDLTDLRFSPGGETAAWGTRILPNGLRFFFPEDVMRNLLRHMPLVCLLVSSLALNAQSRNPYDLELENLRSQWSSAGKLEKLALLDRVRHLRDFVDDRRQVQLLLENVRQSAAENDLVRNEAAAYIDDLRAFKVPTQPQARHWYAVDEPRRRILTEAHTAVRTAASYEILAELERLSGSPEATDHMLQAAELEPTATRWLRAGQFLDEPLRKFAALRNGLSLEPSNSRLNVELATYYVGRQQLEKARDVLAAAAEAAPNDFVIRERRASLFLNLGLRSQALPELHRLEKQWPSPLWLRSRLALDYEQMGLLDDAAHLAASVVAEANDDREQLELLARFHERRHMKYDLQADYISLSRLESSQPDIWSRLAQLQIDCGDAEGGRKSLLKLVALDEENPDAHRRLAQVDESLHLDREAQQELAIASSAIRPDMLAMDAQYLVDPGMLAKNAFSNPPAPADTALADIRVQELLAGGLDRVHVQQLYFVGSDSALDTHRVSTIRYSPSTEELRVIHARAWKPNGLVLDAQELGDREYADTPVSMYYDMRLHQLRFAGLEKGDVVELEYSLAPKRRSAPYSGYFGELVLFAGRGPEQLKRYVLIAPAAQKIFVHAEKIAPASVSAHEGSQVFLWESRSIPALPREPRSPGVTETSPYVHVSTMGDWKQLGSWYADLVRPQFALDQSLQDELTRVTNGLHSDKEKISAIQEFVLRSTHYVALEFGIYSFKPYPVTQIYARRFGDCKDKASLMIALLRAAGIEAEIALVRTRSLGDVMAEPASIALFNHAIVYVPRYDLWLDGTAEYAGRELPLEDQGALSLTVSLSGAAQIRHIPMSRAADNYTRHIIRGELSAQGVIQFSGSTTTRGEDAPGLRHDLAVREQQLDIFRRELAEVFPSVKVDSVAVHGAEVLSSSVNVEFQGALNSTQYKRVVSLSSSWMPRSYVAALAESSTRTQDLVLPLPWTTEEEIHIALPEGTEVTSMPRDQNINSVFGSLRLHYKKSPGEVIIQSHVQFERARVSAQEYPAFRQFCSQAERSFRNEISLSLPQ
jgi:transglutaminase-like putative cysteine protease